MDWSAGYASDVEYTAGFFPEQSPTYLNFCCLLNGFEPVSLEGTFNYFELGFGRGVTLNMLAAAHPQGQFYGNDFMPAHVAGAEALSSSAQLNNLTLLENSFAELAQGTVPDLPQFDFITLHGVYTWVNLENRRHVVDFVARYLKPGGIVFMSYNAMPGWSAILPLQRLLVEHAEVFPNRSDIQIEQARQFIAQLSAVQTDYFEANPVLKTRLESLMTAKPNYLVHEYMHRHWQPIYHADAMRDFASAKLDYVASADLSFNYPSLYLSPERQQILNSIPDPIVRETLKDYILNTGFRKDVFVRGARRMSPVRHADWMQKAGIALTVPRNQVNLSMKLPAIEIQVRDDLYNPILDALEKQPHTFAELLALPALQGQSLANLGQIGALLTASSQASIYFQSNTTVATEPAHRMNHAIASQTRCGDDLQVLVSPLIGNAILTSFVERIVYFLLNGTAQQPDAAELSVQVWRVMALQGRRLLHEGTPIESEEDNIVKLQEMIQSILTDKLPVWRQLRML
jgi:SAM-dependent methyltransferase